MLTSNEHYLLEQLLIKEDYQTYEELAQSLRLSVRSIRNLLAKLQPYFEQNNLELVKKYGFGVKLVSQLTNEKNLIKSVDTSLTYRREVMKLILLFNFRKKTSINKLSEMLFLTKNAVISDLKSIERELYLYDLKIKKDYQGTEVIGERKNIKVAIIDAVHKFGTSIIFDNRKLLSDDEYVATLILVEDFEEEIQFSIKELEEQFAYSFNYDFFKTLVIHIMVDILLFGEIGAAKKGRSRKDIGLYFQSGLEQRLNFHFNDQYNPERFREYCDAFEEMTIEENEVLPKYSAAKELLIAYCQIRNAAFFEEQQLIAKLAKQIEQLDKRAEYRIGIFHPFLNNLMNEHGTDFIALKLSTYVLKDQLPKISDDELCFFLIILANSQMSEKRELTVCIQMNHSSESKKYVQKMLEKELPLSKISICSTDQDRSEGPKVDKRVVFIQNEDLSVQEGKILSMDVLNAGHIAALKHEMGTIRSQKLLIKLNKYFWRETIFIDPFASKRKEDALRQIEAFLSTKELAKEAFIERALMEDNVNPIFWRSKKAALIICSIDYSSKNHLLKFRLPVQIKWRENNELSRVDKIYVLVTAKPDVKDMSLVFREIQFNRLLE